jgi:hypothetical protein
VEGSDRRWRRVIAGEGERWQVEGSERRWRRAIADRGERPQVEASERRWRGAVASEGDRSQVAGCDVGGRHCFPSMQSLGAMTPLGTIRCRRSVLCRRSPPALGTIMLLVVMTAIQCDPVTIQCELVTGSQSFN